jgi:hypothetical protein
MNSNFKRKLLAGLFVPVLGLSVGAAFAQSSGTSTGSGTSATGAGTTGSSGSTAGSSSTGSGASGTTGAGGSATTGSAGAAVGSTGMSGSSGTAGSAGAGMSGSGSWNAQTFDRLDTNHDGMLTREEAQADPALRDAWSRLDSKSAGRVSRSDFEKFRGTQSGNVNTTTGSSASGTGQKVGGSTSGSASGSTGTTK